MLSSYVSPLAAGVAQIVRAHAAALSSLPDTEVSVIALKDPRKETDEDGWGAAQLQLCHVHGPRSFGFSREMNRALLGSDASVVDANGLWMYPSWACLRWRRQTSRPYVVSPHGMLDAWALKRSTAKKAVARALYQNSHLRQAACLRAVCRAEADAFRDLGYTNPICIIPTGMDLPRGAVNAPPPWKKVGGPVLLFLGRLHPKKNVRGLLEAWSTLEKEGGPARHWQLAIAGWDQGGHQRELVEQTSRLGIRQVEFLGPLEGPPKLSALASCAGFVLPSLSEGLPVAVLEAWSWAKAVVMTPECHLPEGFQSGAAISVEASADTIASGIRTLMEMSERQRNEMGRRGRDLVKEKFSWKTVAENARAVYSWVTGENARPACVEVIRD